MARHSHISYTHIVSLVRSFAVFCFALYCVFVEQSGFLCFRKCVVPRVYSHDNPNGWFEYGSVNEMGANVANDRWTSPQKILIASHGHDHKW